jgi:hypothetical protein
MARTDPMTRRKIPLRRGNSFTRLLARSTGAQRSIG